MTQHKKKIGFFMKKILPAILCGLLWAGPACSGKLQETTVKRPVTPPAEETVPPVRGEAEGVYAIWFGKKLDIFDQKWIRGGQITMQWGELETGPGTYDWSALDEQLKAFSKRKLRTTLQFNGNVKPAWMYNVIPYYPGKLSVQVNDPYTLMFWHPRFKKAYADFLAALGEHLKKSAYMDNVLGIRMNLNGYGTEHLNTSSNSPEKDLGPAYWVVPVPGDPDVTAWSKQQTLQYTKEILDAHVKYLAPVAKVFVRNGIEEEIYNAYDPLFRNGTLSWFHTSSEAEPRGNDDKYLVFIDYCRSGLTKGYAEPWASAWGEHGGIVDPRFCSPEQWNYWRVLMDINCGISYLAIYTKDLEVYTLGEKSGETVPASMRAEFGQAFDWAVKYTSQHLYPETTPGAWAALRSCDRSLCWDKPLKYLSEDYTLLTLVQPGKSYGEHNVGPDGQRYGAWARRLPAGESLSVVVDPRFTASVTGTQVTLKVIYLDAGGSKWSVSYAGKTFEVTNNNTGQWVEAVWKVTAGQPVNGPQASELVKGGMVAGRNKPQIAALTPGVTIRAVSGTPAFHLVEILR